jgi:cysteine-rich repeat protein
MVCDNHGGCAFPEQLSQCTGKPNGTSCNYTNLAKQNIAGACNDGLCVPLACGNSIISPDEICDDGNNESGDGCSADCQSSESCGNGVTDTAAGEQCDDNNDVDGDGCQHDCKLPKCGDGIHDTGLDEECDAGSANSNTPDAACRANCQLPRCGDGVRDPSKAEICDDGNNDSADGCSGDCRSDESCGNSVVDALAGEVCDDGNVVAGDGCSADCRSVEVCGNGVTDTAFGEKCDDGNTISGDGCSSDCRSLEVCGNGIIDTLNEQCDLGVNNSNAPDSACRTNCKLPACGDTIVDPLHGEQCDSGIMNGNSPDACRSNCQLARCGDDVQDTSEVCDDGNTSSNDGCSADCNSLEVCGNGIIDTVKGEQCDNGIANADTPNATCRTSCRIQKCGDSIIDTTFGELCDAGAANSDAADAACRLNCSPRRCGDGIKDVAAGEVCDDGNVVSGDNCSADCKSLETCGNSIIDTAKGEQCDSGASNSNGPNAPCRTTCKLPKCGDSIIDTTLGESCDLGASNSNAANAACRLNCLPQRCGDSVVDTAAGETCDDGNTAALDGCSADCKSNETCGNGVLDVSMGEQCDAGASNSNAANAPCRTDCKLPRCGDGAIDTTLGETCDAGAANSNAANATCRLNCQPQRCGDTVVDGMKGEVCDDGNVVSGDNCSADCKSNEMCGNGIIDVVKAEECDNGGLNANTANATCRTSCKSQKCGDSIIDNAFGELCDAGAANSNVADAACRPNCTPRRCGDGIKDVAAGEVCDDTNTTSGDGCSSDCKSLETCGNNIIDIAKGEECDDGNTVNGDGCQGNCKAPKCGDGIVDANEQCDAGAANSNAPNAACRLTCKLPRCGDNIVDTARGEVCDDNNNTSGDGCSANCASNETCGNGIVDPQKGETCDDGNTRTRDGCSACSPETAVVLTPGQTPTGRINPVLVYDAGRQRIVMFGGWTPGPNLADTWEYDGVSWTKIITKHSPAPRFATSAAYDPKRKRVVMFGGYQLNYGAPLDDTWEYDGSDWTLKQPATTPLARAGAAMAFDAINSRLIMFGGATSGVCTTCNTNDTGDPVNETWSYNGTNWTQLAPPTASPYTQPAARSGATAAWDSANKYILMYGGMCVGNGTNCNNPDGGTYAFDGTGWKAVGSALTSIDQGWMIASMAFDTTLGTAGKMVMYRGAANLTYEWNGSGWVSTAFATPTPTRSNPAIAFDAAHKQILSFGGSMDPGTHSDTVYGDTWLRIGSAAWTSLAAWSEPPVRYRAAATYDPARAKVVLFGGQNASTTLSDTWEFDGRKWSQVTPGGVAPGQRAGAVLDYDSNSFTSRLYGGDNGATLNTDILTYDGASYGSTSSATRQTAKGATMSYDGFNKKVVTFGGTITNVVTSQTWTWSTAGGWVNANPPLVPPARDDTATAYDPVRRRTVLFSGNPRTGGTLQDTYEWDNASWSLRSSTGPTPRSGHRMFYNPDAQRVCVFGASTSTSEDLWEWDGTQWLQRAVSGSVASKTQPAVAYDAVRHRIVAFSGADGTNAPTAGTALLTYRPNLTGESCVDAQIDYDGDGKLGCADDECWPVCDPLKPPGLASRPTGAPFCGDGTCKGAEDCRMCPADCGTCAGARCGDYHCDPGETNGTCPNDC